MKIAFINPSPDNNPGSPDRWKSISFAATPPLGLLYLATVLRNEGVEVSLLDQAAKGLSTEQTVKWIRREDPDILGLTTMTGSGQTAATVATEAKNENPNVTTVFGGYHATVNAERLLQKYPCIDVAVRGEGENTTIELIDCIRKKQDLKNVRGITFKKKQCLVDP
jgi:anaerobic magnesium-protoporphyrin IX monomethyl ester cyclase